MGDLAARALAQADEGEFAYAAPCGDDVNAVPGYLAGVFDHGHNGRQMRLRCRAGKSLDHEMLAARCALLTCWY